MVAEVGLKDFIIEVKKELLEASKAGESNPTLELQKLELEASVCLGAKAEGSWGVFIKIGGGASAEKDQKIHLTFSPIKRIIKRISTSNTRPPDGGEGYEDKLFHEKNAATDEELLGPGVCYEEVINEEILHNLNSLTDSEQGATVDIEILSQGPEQSLA